MSSRTSPNQQGFTLIELVIVIVLLGALTATAVPIFTNLQDEAQQAAEDAVIGNVRSAISLKYAESAVTGTPAFPATLDSAAASSSASDSNPFFTTILVDPITNDWSKTAGGNYTGPAGGEYAYDSTSGKISKQ